MRRPEVAQQHSSALILSKSSLSWRSSLRWTDKPYLNCWGAIGYLFLDTSQDIPPFIFMTAFAGVQPRHHHWWSVCRCHPVLSPLEAWRQDHPPQPRQLPFWPESPIFLPLRENLVLGGHRLNSECRPGSEPLVTQITGNVRPNLALWFTFLKIWAQIFSYPAETRRVQSIANIFIRTFAPKLQGIAFLSEFWGMEGCGLLSLLGFHHDQWVLAYNQCSVCAPDCCAEPAFFESLCECGHHPKKQVSLGPHALDSRQT